MGANKRWLNNSGAWLKKMGGKRDWNFLEVSFTHN